LKKSPKLTTLPSLKQIKQNRIENITAAAQRKVRNPSETTNERHGSVTGF